MGNEQTQFPFANAQKRPGRGGRKAGRSPKGRAVRRGRLMRSGKPMRPLAEGHRRADGIRGVSVTKGVRVIKRRENGIAKWKAARSSWTITFRCSSGGCDFTVSAFALLDANAFVIGSLSIKRAGGKPVADGGEIPDGETAASICNYLFKIARDNGANMAFALPKNEAEARFLTQMGFSELQREELPGTIESREGAILEAPVPAKTAAPKEPEKQLGLF